MAHLLEQLLALESDWLSSAARDECTGLVARVVEHCRSSRRRNAQQGLAELSRAVYGTPLGIRCRIGPPDLDFRLGRTLTRRFGSCLGISSVYLVLGELLDLPLEAVAVDGHVLVRLLTPTQDVYIETTRNGAQLGNRMIRLLESRAGTPPRALSRAEFVAVHLSNRAAFVLAPAGEWEAALSSTERALELFPDYAGAWINRAAVLVQLRRLDLARASLEQSLRCRPGVYGRRCAARVGERLESAATPGEPRSASQPRTVLS
ncbi:MAG TPA: transglutaminase family protein [Planctomycetota bacterium]|nr:transglutaminase family protein [Planctomycetota bacterium]